MNLLRRAVCAAAVIAANVILIGCGSNFRPIATPVPVPSGNPAGAEIVAVLNQCPSGMTCIGFSGAPTGSVITAIDVSGDTNLGNKQLQNRVGDVAGPVPGSLDSPLAWDAARTSIYTANTSTDTISQLLLNTGSTGFADTTNTLTLPAGAAPISVSFEYFGATYAQDYVVDRGSGAPGWLGTCPTGGGGLTAITQASATVKAIVCLGANTEPVEAWIYRDQSKVFVADFAQSKIYVIGAAKLQQVTNTISLPAGSGPFKFSQNNDGLFLYVLNASGSISVIDAQAETLVNTIATSNPLTSALPVDMVRNTNFNDTSANTQVNHVWILHADGAVSVWDGTTPGTLSWITSIATITPAQRGAGAFPTNLALLRDGTWAYVGIGNTDQMVAIDTSKLARGAVTPAATTSITVGTHRSIHQTLTNNITPASPISANVLVENTTPMVTAVGVSRQGMLTGNTGGSAQLSKAYATTTTQTTYFCYDQNVTPTDCSNSDPWANGSTITALPAATPFLVTPECTDLGQVAGGLFAMSCPNLYNETTIVTAAGQQATPTAPAIPVNTPVATIAAPSVVTYCDPGNPSTGEYSGQKNCPAMLPELVLGRS